MDWKICPLMSRSIVDPTGDCPQVIFDEIPCKEADCALWRGDACAIVQIADPAPAGGDLREAKICPILSRQGWVNSTRFESHQERCPGTRCGMYALCQGRIDLSGKDVKLTPPAVPGL